MTWMYSGFLFFFFQAEDGIRDVAVTGVQTCALPISGAHGTRRGRLGGSTGTARRGGDPLDLDGHRRHPARLRPSPHAGRRAGGADSGDRVGRGGDARATCARAPRPRPPRPPPPPLPPLP